MSGGNGLLQGISKKVTPRSCFVLPKWFVCSGKHVWWHNTLKQKRSIHPGIFITNGAGVAWIVDVNLENMFYVDDQGKHMFGWRQASYALRRMIKTLLDRFDDTHRAVLVPSVKLQVWSWISFEDWHAERNPRRIQIELEDLDGWDVMCVHVHMHDVVYKNVPWQAQHRYVVDPPTMYHGSNMHCRGSGKRGETPILYFKTTPRCGIPRRKAFTSGTKCPSTTWACSSPAEIRFCTRYSWISVNGSQAQDPRSCSRQWAQDGTNSNAVCTCA